MAVDDLISHLDRSVSPAHSTAHSAGRLREAGFGEIAFDSWGASLPPRGFVRSAGLLLAWCGTGGPFRVVGAHTDSPTLRLKPRPDSGSHGWKQIAVEVYGGILNNSWLDRDLAVAGRLILDDGRTVLVDTEDPVARIPQLAVHLDREVNERGLVLDRQIHLSPVWGLGTSSPGDFLQLLAERADVKSTSISTHDLVMYDTTPARVLADGALLASGRLDNQVSCWAATSAIIDVARSGINENTFVIALFDHEEVGSESTHGAAGPQLDWLLRTLHGADEGSFRDRCAKSLCVSADNAHSVHPNYPERHEPGHRPIANGGPVIKSNANQRYATTAETAAMFEKACVSAGVPYQWFVSKNTMPCGSTIGPITSTRLGIPTVDVGVAQLSMHSAREMCGAHDPDLLVRALTAVGNL
ncbi:MAG: M18 family aminopeptidase [Ilumatobacteraceae bacterium]|jgi:aspartyl aminopeptidase|nr:M18 family aminopeptidase [Ilumatobacteraceae bacterium]